MPMQQKHEPCRGRISMARNLGGLGLALALTAWGIQGHAGETSQDEHGAHDLQKQEMDHSQMDHSQMDHSQMGHDADDPHAEHRKAMAGSADQAATAEIEIAEGYTLLNQHGESVDFRRDVIGDRIAVIDFVYTSCTTVCPVVSTIFSQLQDRLGDLLEKDVALVTLTVDPARDTPHRLMSYSKNFQPGPNWSWLTGEKRIMDKVLTELGAYTPLYEDHPAMVLIGDESKSEWYRLYGFPAPDKIESRVREMLAHRQH